MITTRLTQCLALLAMIMAITGLSKPAQATDVQRVISPGGLEAWLVQDPTLPVLSVRFSFNAGSSYDPADLPGTASLLASMLTKGAGTLDEDTFRRRLGERSIRLGFEAYNDNFYGSLTTLSPRQAEAFDLLALALNEPRFDQEPLARTQEQVVAGIKRSQAQVARRSADPHSQRHDRPVQPRGSSSRRHAEPGAHQERAS
ncbi:MAG: insulinase family protein, partial [Pseudomonadota bacterium]